MKGKLKKVLSLSLALIMLNGMAVSAETITTKETDSDKIIVEIIYNANGEDFADDIVFEDGTKLSDYDYILKELPELPKLFRSSYPLGDYFDYCAWITRDGVVSLSLDPKDTVRDSGSLKDTAWNVVLSPIHGMISSGYWNNTQVMGWQYDCHYTFANDKDYWNLEPHRTASNYLVVVANACNP